MPAVSVVIPVKNGMPLLERVLEAVRAQGDLELIVIDSGSTDGSQDAARAAGAELIEIAPSRVRARPHAQPGRRARHRAT